MATSDKRSKWIVQYRDQVNKIVSKHPSSLTCGVKDNFVRVKGFLIFFAGIIIRLDEINIRLKENAEG